MEAALRVAGGSCSGALDIVGAIAGLLEKSLLETRLDRGQPQYRFLHTTRAYALGKLEEHAELDMVSARHAEYVAEQLESERATVLALAKAERFTIDTGQLGHLSAALERHPELHPPRTSALSKIGANPTPRPLVKANTSEY